MDQLGLSDEFMIEQIRYTKEQILRKVIEICRDEMWIELSNPIEDTIIPVWIEHHEWLIFAFEMEKAFCFADVCTLHLFVLSRCRNLKELCGEIEQIFQNIGILEGAT
ncbi:hypothetical protein KW783_01635 [Candidatus Parcubacteria bacterium]|nr:hypothetical protein [Candidatus Parcubacteria bacterium]